MRPTPMSLKFGSPLLGYNNNVRHKGRVFHIQTEDSGAKYGHIITHLFMDGGRILKSVKTSYAEYLESDRRAEIVRDMMKQQHKAMAIALRDGKFDPMVEGNTGASQGTLALVAGAQEIPPIPAPAKAPSSRRVRTAQSTEPPPSAALDLDRLERATAAASTAAALRPQSDLPPPPGNLLREKTAKGTYRVTPSSAAPGTSSSSRGASSSRPAGATSTSAPPSGASGRPGAARPASSFGQARPQGQSMFGEMTDKSLDEVILSYLAAELETEKK